jgi:hypothetical protein
MSEKCRQEVLQRIEDVVMVDTPDLLDVPTIAGTVEPVTDPNMIPMQVPEVKTDTVGLVYSNMPYSCLRTDDDVRYLCLR